MPAHRTICVFLFCLITVFTKAQAVFDRANVFSVEQGLPSNAIRSIDKSRDGFIWIGTSDGLCRFDGYRFKIFKHIPTDSNSISDNRINCVLAAGDSIWAATELGLSILNIHNHRISNMQFSTGGVSGKTERQSGFGINLVHKDTRGDIWVGTRSAGLFRFNKQDKKFESFFWQSPDTIPENIAYNHILSISASRDNDSIVYAGTVAGLLEINRFSKNIGRHYFPNANKKYETALNAFRRIYYHDNGILYMGNWSTGVHTFFPESGGILPLKLNGETGNDILLQSAVGRIMRKSANEIWITSIMGMVELQTDSNRISFKKENDFNNLKFYGVDFIDDDNRAWLCSSNGLYVFDPVVQQFSTWEYKNPGNGRWGFNFYIIEDVEANNLVILPRFGAVIYHFNLKNKSWLREELKLPTNHKGERFIVRGFARGPDGTYSIATDNGLFNWNDKQKVIKQIVLPGISKTTRYGDILWDAHGPLWLSAYEDGLYCWHPQAGKVNHYKNELIPTGTDPSANSIISLFQDSKKNIWISRNNGFVVYKTAEKKFYPFLAEKDSNLTFSVVIGFAEDAKGRVWMNGRDGRIGFADLQYPEKGLVKKFDFFGLHGLTDIPQIRADAGGNIWGYTKNNLFKIDAETLVPEKFDFGYGVGEPDFYSFNTVSGSKVVFGRRNGIVLADTKLLRLNSEKPEPYITQIQILEKPNTIGMVIVDTNQLKLKYWQNFFSFAFSAKAFTLGNAVKFRYRLENFENEWTQANERNFVNYTNIPAGQYNFQVQAANNEGVWNNVITSLPVYIATAWWNTWLFRISAFVIVVIIAWQLYRNRLKQVRDKTRLKLEFEKKLANVEMSALLAQMNPHFLFNSLNSIDSYIIRNESKQASEYLNSFARLMRLILNNSRSNYISLKDELETLDLYLQMESLRFKDRFVYEIQVDDAIDTNQINIPPMLVQPYVENAIWHGLMHREPGKGESRVVIRIKKTNAGITCTIQDNGIGRNRASAIGSRKGSKSRKSMGMRITEDRIEIINKLYNTDTRVFIEDLTDTDGEPEGTRVELTIPA